MASTGEAGLGRRPELDGLRGVAILLVVVGHAFPALTALASAGVTLFFALSGYLITGILLTERRRTGRVDLRRFYWRRTTRLAPPLLVMLAVTAPLLGATWREVVPAATWTANYTRVAGWESGGYGHMWSLAVEEQFYLLWPLLLLGLTLVRRPVVVLGLAVALLAAWRLLLTADGGAWYAYAALETAGVPILGGALVAVARWRLRPAWATLGVVGIVGIGCALVGPVAWLWAPVLATPLAVVAVAAADGARWLTLPSLRWLGAASYSLYLWHEPVSRLLGGGALAVLVGAVVGAVAWRVVEVPLMSWREGSRGERRRPDLQVAERDVSRVGVQREPSGPRERCGLALD